MLIQLFVFFVCLNSAHQVGDTLGDAKARQKIIVQRMESRVNETIRSAKGDPDGAKQIIETQIKELKNDLWLPESKRQELLSKLQTQLVKIPPPKLPDNPILNAKPLRDSVTGLPIPPRRIPPPGSPEAIAAGMIGERKNAIVKNADVRKRMEDSQSNELRRVAEGAVIPNGDMTFSPDYADRQKRRQQLDAAKDKQKPVRDALMKQSKSDYNQISLEDFFSSIEKEMGIDLVVDWVFLDNLQLGKGTEISVKGNGKTYRSILRKVLNDYGLVYILRDDKSLEITSAEVARARLITKVLYVGDLVLVGANQQVVPPPGSGPYWGGWYGFQLTQEQAQLNNNLQIWQNLVGLEGIIKGTGDPESWAPIGPGTINFDLISKSLIIKQSAEYHYKHGP